MDLPETHGLNLRSDRLILRPLTQADAPDLLRTGGQAAVARMFQSIPHPWTKGHCADWIAKAAWTGAMPFRLGVVLPDGPLIGTVGVGGSPVYIGYFIDPQFAGNGYATEAAHCALHFIFQQFSPDMVVAEHFDDNPASGVVLRRLGFEKTGFGMATSLARLEPAPNTLYRLKRADLVAPQRKA